MNKKYEFTDGAAPTGLRRIRLLRSLRNLEPGTLGGFIADESCLSHTGDCWVSDNAKVIAGSTVCGNAYVGGYVKVSGTSVIGGYAFVAGHALIFDSTVTDNAYVRDIARVEYSTICGNSKIYGEAIITNATPFYLRGPTVVDSKICGPLVKLKGSMTLSGVTINGDCSITNEEKFPMEFGESLDLSGARIRCHSDYSSVSTLGRYYKTLAAFRSRNGITFATGIFSGTETDFKKLVEQRTANSATERENYVTAIKYLSLRLQHLAARLEWNNDTDRVIPPARIDDSADSMESFVVNKMKKLRLDAGLSQRECAEKLGTRQSMIAKLELGEMKVTVKHLHMYAKGFSVPIHFFLFTN